MKTLALAAGAIWVAAAVAIPCLASTEKSAAMRHPAQAHDTLAGASPINTTSRTGKPGVPLVSEASARRIAWRSGLDRVEEVALLGDQWEVAGRDRSGNEKTLAIHAHDGRILN